jgi:succinate dehydrogenase / fumarate reductase, cytochrome b subunit
MPGMSARFYIIAMTFLASHLVHGFQSVFQTLGLRSQKSAATLQQLSIAYAPSSGSASYQSPSPSCFGFGR